MVVECLNITSDTVSIIEDQHDGRKKVLFILAEDNNCILDVHIGNGRCISLIYRLEADGPVVFPTSYNDPHMLSEAIALVCSIQPDISREVRRIQNV